MTARQRLAKDALRMACRFRRDADIDLQAAICVPDLAERIGVEVRYLDVPSMEGMYSKHPRPTIVISSLRPAGRQAYTCGHELGHHAFGHGSHIDELIVDDRGGRTEDKEFLVDCFSGFLLMPKPAVVRAFDERGFAIETAKPQEIYVVACWLGVGYGTLITHMQASLGLFGRARADRLRRTTPKDIKSKMLGEPCSEVLVAVDHCWSDRPIDIQVGDMILAPKGAIIEGQCVGVLGERVNGALFAGVVPGLGRLCDEATGWTSFVRVSRHGYVGRNLFRHFEEVVDDDDDNER